MSKHDRSGISPILAVLLLIAITLMIAGAAVLWFFSFIDQKESSSSLYSFDVSLNSESDEINMVMMNGKAFNSSRMSVVLAGVELNLTHEMIRTGNDHHFHCGIDIIKGEDYSVRIFVDQKLVFNQERTAK